MKQVLKFSVMILLTSTLFVGCKNDGFRSITSSENKSAESSSGAGIELPPGSGDSVDSSTTTTTTTTTTQPQNPSPTTTTTTTTTTSSSTTSTSTTSTSSSTTTTQPPPPGLWAVRDWNFPDGDVAAIQSDPSLSGGGNAGGTGFSAAATLNAPGPWGGYKVLENHYGITPATSQPQVGTYWQLPAPVTELYIQTWVKFGSNWEIGPDNPLYPGNYDHKAMFVMEKDPNQPYFPFRWEWKVGVWYTTMPASAHSHDTFYAYMKDPMTGNNLNAFNSAWDGQWHEVKWHLKMGTQGQMRIWWDGQLVVDSGVMDMKTGNNYFHSILFGGNRNQGTDQPMSFFFGPAYLYRVDPGW